MEGNATSGSSPRAGDDSQSQGPVVPDNASLYQEIDSRLDADAEDPDHPGDPEADEDGDEDHDDDDDEDGDEVFHDAMPGVAQFGVEIVMGDEHGPEVDWWQQDVESDDDHEFIFAGDEDEGEEDEEDEEDDDEEDDPNEDDDDAARHIMGLFREGARTGLLTRAQLMALIRNRDLTNVLFNHDDDEDDDDDGGYVGQWARLRRRRRQPKDPNRFPKVPSEEGIKLMRTGYFGANDYDHRNRKKTARRMLERELGLGGQEQRTRNSDILTQSLVPGTQAEQIIHYDNPIYSGQFSDDGNFFFSCCQDFNVRMYDTSNPYEWKHYKTVAYNFPQWTLTDASLSPDNRWLAYTSIQSMVCIAPTDPNDTGDPYSLDLDDGRGRPTGWGWRNGGSFGIWSVRFSGDGRELVAGTNANSIVVYDIESRRVLHHIEGHEDDVNAVCFADKSSPHIVYSGSDDATIKIWDRRSMGDKREAGAFVGHIEGLTYIDSKGDGRYILSNGKDQSMKLWDLRMVMSTNRFRELDPQRHSQYGGFDYRRAHYDQHDWDVHPHDNSLVTFRGHEVLRTLIRCHFSPPTATNSRYVYSGSADGKVYIWNMDATLAGTVDVKKATKGTRRHDRQTRFYYDQPGGWDTCVRDASWHPSAPVMVASAWNGYSMARGTCTLHSFNESREDEAETGPRRSVNDMLEPNPDLYPQTSI